MPYPGGVTIDRLARAEKGNPKAVALPRAQLGPDSLDFSFSGLKTAVLNARQDPALASVTLPDWAASVQEAIVDVLISKTLRAARQSRRQPCAASRGRRGELASARGHAGRLRA